MGSNLIPNSFLKLTEVNSDMFFNLSNLFSNCSFISLSNLSIIGNVVLSNCGFSIRPIIGNGLLSGTICLIFQAFEILSENGEVGISIIGKGVKSGFISLFSTLIPCFKSSIFVTIVLIPAPWAKLIKLSNLPVKANKLALTLLLVLAESWIGGIKLLKSVNNFSWFLAVLNLFSTWVLANCSGDILLCEPVSLNAVLILSAVPFTITALNSSPTSVICKELRISPNCKAPWAAKNVLPVCKPLFLKETAFNKSFSKLSPNKFSIPPPKEIWRWIEIWSLSWLNICFWVFVFSISACVSCLLLSIRSRPAELNSLNTSPKNSDFILNISFDLSFSKSASVICFCFLTESVNSNKALFTSSIFWIFNIFSIFCLNGAAKSKASLLVLETLIWLPIPTLLCFSVASLKAFSWKVENILLKDCVISAPSFKPAVLVPKVLSFWICLLAAKFLRAAITSGEAKFSWKSINPAAAVFCLSIKALNDWIVDLTEFCKVLLKDSSSTADSKSFWVKSSATFLAFMFAASNKPIDSANNLSWLESKALANSSNWEMSSVLNIFWNDFLKISGALISFKVLLKKSLMSFAPPVCKFVISKPPGLPMFSVRKSIKDLPCSWPSFGVPLAPNSWLIKLDIIGTDSSVDFLARIGTVTKPNPPPTPPPLDSILCPNTLSLSSSVNFLRLIKSCTLISPSFACKFCCNNCSNWICKTWALPKLPWETAPKIDLPKFLSVAKILANSCFWPPFNKATCPTVAFIFPCWISFNLSDIWI